MSLTRAGTQKVLEELAQVKSHTPRNVPSLDLTWLEIFHMEVKLQKILSIDYQSCTSVIHCQIIARNSSSYSTEKLEGWLRTWVLMFYGMCWLFSEIIFLWFFSQHQCTNAAPPSHGPALRAATSSSLPRLASKSHLETATLGNTTLNSAAYHFGTIKVIAKMKCENMTWKARFQNDSF